MDVITQGWPTGLPGLSVTLDYHASLRGLKRYGFTHTKSGLGFHVGALSNKWTAIRYAKSHFGVVDWTFDKDHITNQSGAVRMYKQSVDDLVLK
jgi:hypothetical protein